MLSQPEQRDILLWFGWSALLGYSTDPRSYLREALKPANRALLLEMPRAKRKAILRFVIDEHQRRLKLFCWPWQNSV